MTLKLHIGGRQTHPDWKIFDAEERPEVDFVGNAKDLSQFEDNSVEAIYASHVLEHFYYCLGSELLDTLSEWYRVLTPGGQLYVSVPDLRTLCWLYTNPNLFPVERMQLMGILYGGQTNQWDVHKAGFDFDILAMYLEEVGFLEYEQISEFGLFDDCSSMRLLDTLISLNVIATKGEASTEDTGEPETEADADTEPQIDSDVEPETVSDESSQESAAQDENDRES